MLLFDCPAYVAISSTLVPPLYISRHFSRESGFNEMYLFLRLFFPLRRVSIAASRLSIDVSLLSVRLSLILGMQPSLCNMGCLYSNTEMKLRFRGAIPFMGTISNTYC